MKQQDDVVRYHEGFGFVKGTVIHLENVKGVRISVGKLIEKQLIAIAIDLRQLQKELLSRGRFDRPVQPKGFELPLPGAQRLHAQTRDQASNRRLQAKSTFILSEVANAFKLWFGNRSVLFQKG